jgi:hypothetical protein
MAIMDAHGGGSRLGVLAKNLPRDRFFSPAGTVMRFVDNAVPRVFSREIFSDRKSRLP